MTMMELLNGSGGNHGRAHGTGQEQTPRSDGRARKETPPAIRNTERRARTRRSAPGGRHVRGVRGRRMSEGRVGGGEVATIAKAQGRSERGGRRPPAPTPRDHHSRQGIDARDRQPKASNKGVLNHKHPLRPSAIHNPASARRTNRQEGIRAKQPPLRQQPPLRARRIRRTSLH